MNLGRELLPGDRQPRRHERQRQRAKHRQQDERPDPCRIDGRGLPAVLESRVDQDGGREDQPADGRDQGRGLQPGPQEAGLGQHARERHHPWHRGQARDQVTHRQDQEWHRTVHGELGQQQRGRDHVNDQYHRGVGRQQRLGPLQRPVGEGGREQQAEPEARHDGQGRPFVLPAGLPSRQQ